MFRFPFYGYPYNYPYYKPYNIYYNNNDKQLENKIEKSSITNTDNVSNTTNSNNESNIFEIFGIKLYLDDLIILGILFFLYEQNVKDEMLYIILFLLLLS